MKCTGYALLGRHRKRKRRNTALDGAWERGCATFTGAFCRHRCIPPFNSDWKIRRGCRDLCSFIFWLAATEASTAASKGEHHPESSNPATTSPSCLPPSLPLLLQPLRHAARASTMIYMMSCTRGPVTECTLHANLAGLRVLRTAGVSRLQSGQRSWEDAWERRDAVDQQ